jgi:site-specific recombinase XerD
MAQNSNPTQTLKELLAHIEDAYAPNTIRAYRADFRGFIAYCAQCGEDPLPADPLTIARYVLHLTELPLKSASIRRKVITISAMHRYSYLEDPTKHPEVKIALRKMNRRLGTRPQQAQPIDRTMLDQMLACCDESLRGTRNRMLLELAYGTLRRRSELTSLLVDDWARKPDGTSVILLRQSKTDQTATGIPIKLNIRTTEAIQAWLETSQLTSGPLLRGIQGNTLNNRLYPGQIARIFKTLAKTASLNPTGISGHSTRIGAAQDLLRHGCSIGQIMAQVGWHKVDTVMHYLGATAIDVIQSQASGR